VKNKKEDIKVKVILPSWWTNGVTIYGWTDAVDTYCCELRPSWFVEVPEYDYSGYFFARDLARA